MPKTSPKPLLSHRINGIARVNPSCTRDMSRYDRVIYQFNLNVHRSKIVNITSNYLLTFHQILFKLQHFGIIRSGDIPYLYIPPIPFFKRIGHQLQPRIGINNFLLEPDIVRRRISTQQRRNLVNIPIPIPTNFPKFQLRRSLRIAEKRIAKLTFETQRIQQLAAESLLDGTFKEKMKSKQNFLGIACQDKLPMTLNDQLKLANKRKHPPKPSYWRRWIYPDEYTCHKNIHYYIQSLPFELQIKPADIRLQPIVRHWN